MFRISALDTDISVLSIVMEGFLSKRPNLDAYAVQAAHVFSTDNLPLNQSDVHSAFKGVQKTYSQYIKAWWEITSLETYVQQKIIYRGLRINLNPTNHLDNTEFIQGWQSILTSSSLKLLDYLLGWERRFFALTSAQLEKEISDIQQFRGTPDFDILEKRLQQYIESLQVEIRERKHKKYIRDKRDFESGQIYNIKTTTKNFNNYRTNKSYTDQSESEVSGTDESVGAPKNPKRYPKNNKNKRPPQHWQRPQYQNRNYGGDLSRQTPLSPPRKSLPPKQIWQQPQRSEVATNVHIASEYYGLPSNSSSTLQNVTTNQAPSVSLAPVSMATVAMAPGPMISMPMAPCSTTLSAQNPSPLFLGPPGIQLRDREVWGYQGKETRPT